MCGVIFLRVRQFPTVGNPGLDSPQFLERSRSRRDDVRARGGSGVLRSFAKRTHSTIHGEWTRRTLRLCDRSKITPPAYKIWEELSLTKPGRYGAGTATRLPGTICGSYENTSRLRGLTNTLSQCTSLVPFAALLPKVSTRVKFSNRRP